MEKWIFDSPDLAGEAFRQFIKQFYQGNGFVNGGIEIDGEAGGPGIRGHADPEHLRRAGSPGATGRLARVARSWSGSSDYTELSFKGGSYRHLCLQSRATRSAECDPRMAGETGTVTTKLRTALLLLLSVAVSIAPALAAPSAPSAATRAEILALMEALSTSGCRFERNGDWYGANEARAHLQRKYDYLLKKGKIDTPEQFIERAAARSSMSGRAYRVDCGGSEQDASAWFKLQLERLRDSGATAR